jgi:UDP-N-acetylglucosamine:LPS N-acetylglucosamine transferase
VTRPRVLFAMITVGQGHRAAAEAGAAWLERVHPGRFEIEVVDFTAAVGDVRFDARHKAAWRRMLAAPWTAYLGQRFVDDVVPARLSRGVQGLLLRGHARHAAAWLAPRRDDLIVATHFFTAQALALARTRHGLRTPFVVVNPDLRDAHALWAEPRADAFAVFSQRARSDLVRHGVPAGRIAVFDPLLRPGFERPCTQERRHLERERLGIGAGDRVALWSAGGEGRGGDLERVLDRLDRRGTELTVVALCGRNEGLLTRLRARAARDARVRLLPFGFRDDVERLLCASDLFVGKAGPASTAEALAMGVPVVHAGFAGANEKAVVDWVVEGDLGRFAPGPDRLAATLDQLVRDPDDYAALRARVRAAGVRNGGADWARWLAATFLAPAPAGPEAGA